MNDTKDNLHQTTEQRIRTIAALVLAVIFIFGQSESLQHIHVDGELSAGCEICHYADNSPAPLANQTAQHPAVFVTGFPSISTTFVEIARLLYDHLSRAPPVSKLR